MMVTGEQGLTVEEQKIHFALWCIMSSPLMLGNDPRNMTEEELSIITNKRAIAINQDPTEQGKRIKKEGDAEIWAKKLNNGKTAVLFLNRNEKNASKLTLLPEDIGLTGKVKAQNVYTGKKTGTFRESFTQTIPPREGLFLLIK
jgi:alpha-galactosidase